MFNDFLKSPIKLRLFFAFAFIVFAIIITLISFAISYNYESQYVTNEIEKKASSFIKGKTKQLKDVIETHKETLNALVANPLFKNYLQTNQDKESVQALFEQIIAADKHIMQIRYINGSGDEKIRFDRKEEGATYKQLADAFLQNKKDRYYFQEVSTLTQNSPIWISDIDLNVENGKLQRPYVPTIRFAVPIYENNHFKGMLLINLFMKTILKEITTSSFFIVSLLDRDGECLVGYSEVDGNILDFSWSRYLLEKVDIKRFAPHYIKNILGSYEFRSDIYNSKKIHATLGIPQELILVLKVREAKIKEIKENTLSNMLDTLLLVLLFSGPVGVLFAFIPSFLASKVYDASKKFNEKSLLFDEYLEAMNVNNIISKSDTKGRITYANENFCKVSGYTEDEVIGKPHSLLRNPEEKKETFKILWLTIQSGKTWRGFLRNIKKNGGFYDVDIAIIPIFNLKNEIVEFLAIRHEITELVAQRKEMLNIATKDPLTGVGNRYKLNIDIQKQLLNNVAIIDIDNFSTVNDFYGHKIGDEVIRKFSQLLLENLTNEFELYRLHSDKFAIHNYTLDSKRFINFMSLLNAKMIESIIDIGIETFDLVCTSGISSSENSTIISTAEIANKYAKKMKIKVLEYSKNLNIEEGFERNITWTRKVKEALHDDRIIMYYQAIVDNSTKKIDKYEALVRLEDEDGSIISPYYFLDIAKTSGQYIDITKVVIAKSFAYFEHKDVSFSINFTIEDILNKELNIYLEEMIEKYKIADKLVIEIVESEGIEEFEIVQKFIQKMKSRACKIAIDDFGTGYSNFEYLTKIDADFIKIDGSMIKNINNDKNMKEIVKTIIEFAKKMNLKTIAEFVATKEILDTVEELGIDYSQGYYLGMPSATTEIKS